MNRVIVFIDGFNLYHSIDRVKEFRSCKWLDLQKLVRCFATSKDEIREVYYFSAYANWRPESANRHRHYVRALEATNVKIVLGRFKVKDTYCIRCKATFQKHEEKETDVNIAIKMFETAVSDSFDTAFLISGDSDLLPAVRAIKKSFPHKQIHSIIPPGIGGESLKETAHMHKRIKAKHLLSSRLADPFISGELTLPCPTKWK